ncbi:hypothetical protein GTO91_01810 [Heliobacterium undosum]|uniref:Uncharacterized protein n=1 Tax=Heliomicrobium undosum TaxID=121734 RepID=A0A845L0M0_9FIRM|nr:hypothetical protein [Heliomicrobium undosum]
MIRNENYKKAGCCFERRLDLLDDVHERFCCYAVLSRGLC